MGERYAQQIRWLGGDRLITTLPTTPPLTTPPRCYTRFWPDPSFSRRRRDFFFWFWPKTRVFVNNFGLWQGGMLAQIFLTRGEEVVGRNRSDYEIANRFILGSRVILINQRKLVKFEYWSFDLKKLTLGRNFDLKIWSFDLKIWSFDLKSKILQIST